MARYRVEVKKSAVKELSDLPKKDLRRIVAGIRELADNLRPPGSMKLSAEERYRIRQGHYRIPYTVDDKALAVSIVKIAHRRGIYR
jgi:mRNA interferase RelE/StbE